MKIVLAALAALCLALPAAADEASDRAALERALTNMTCGGRVGEQLAEIVRAKAARISIRFAQQNEPIVRTDANGVATFTLTDRVKDSSRGIAVYLAKLFAPELLRDMADSHEKAYMIRSYELRAWLELGGDPAGLPAIDGGYRDQALSDEFKVWLGNSEAALGALGRAAGWKPLSELISEQEDFMRAARLTPEGSAREQAKLDALKADDRRFVAQLIEDGALKRERGVR